jgi:hypothetical protein
VKKESTELGHEARMASCNEEVLVDEARKAGRARDTTRLRPIPPSDMGKEA